MTSNVWPTLAVTTYNETNGLPHPDVRAVFEDHTGQLWVGTDGGGVVRIRAGTIATFTMTNGLSSNHAWTFHEDAAGALWIGTEHGLNRLAEGRFDVFTTAEGLCDDNVHSILEDDSGRMWFGADHGIFHVAKEELIAVASGRASTVRCVRYGEADGLPVSETNGQKNQPSAIKGRDGRLWFATPKGVVIIDPRTPPETTVPPAVALERIQADGEVVFDNGGGVHPSPNSKLETRNSQLQLPPGRGRILEIHYTASTFIAPELTHFKYRLDGYDTDWQDAGTRRVAFYTNLRPGLYRFRVLAANHHNLWSERGVSFDFRLTPFIYQTWWFRSVCAAAVVLAIYGLHRWRLGYERTIAGLRVQTAVASERAGIARDLHDGLGATLSQLRLLTDAAERQPADTRNGHLHRLAETGREAARLLRDLLWSTDPGDETLEGFVQRLQQHAEELLRPAGLRPRWEIPDRLPLQPLRATLRHNLFLAAREALHNAARHAAASEVTIRVEVQGRRLTLSIQDNGRGLSLDQISLWNGESPPAAANSKPEARNSKRESSGRGLKNIRVRLEQLGGGASIKSRPGSGTCIIFDLPLSAISRAADIHS